jgi:RNA-directed DNA polymerase
MADRAFIADNLAAALLSGAWSAQAMARRLAQAWGRRERWQPALGRLALQRFPTLDTRPAVAALSRFIQATAVFVRAWEAACARGYLPLGRFFCLPEGMSAGRTATIWNVPALVNASQLADWLGVSLGEVDWLADYQARLPRTPPGPRHHYSYRWQARRRGQFRLLEVPKARLKHIQRRILHEILDRIPAHPAAHGYCRGRSLLSYLAPHADRRVVVHFDLRQFFPSIAAARVHALFRTAGYPRQVARLLTALCTNCVPVDVLEARPVADRDAQERLRWPHLPQGAPTSPALANLCVHRLDRRLAGLARALAAGYTRYADDLVFSGGEELERSLRRFQVMVCRLALEEGLEVNTRKSRFMRQGVRQQVAGIVLNEHPNIQRAEYDRLKATLTNCVRHGPASQNRAAHVDFRAHLAGRVAYFAQVNPARAARLQQLFRRIDWGAAHAR